MTLEFQMIEVPERFVRGLLKGLLSLSVQRFAIAGWRERYVTEHALRCLSDRDLADMGIARHHIREIARCGTVGSGTRPTRSESAKMEVFGSKEPPIPSGWVESLADPFGRRHADSCRTAKWRGCPTSPEADH